VIIAKPSADFFIFFRALLGIGVCFFGFYGLAWTVEPDSCVQYTSGVDCLLAWWPLATVLLGLSVAGLVIFLLTVLDSMPNQLNRLTGQYHAKYKSKQIEWF